MSFLINKLKSFFLYYTRHTPHDTMKEQDQEQKVNKIITIRIKKKNVAQAPAACMIQRHVDAVPKNHMSFFINGTDCWLSLTDHTCICKKTLENIGVWNQCGGSKSRLLV